MLLRNTVHLVTDFGDAALLVPASAILVIYLLYARSTKTASVWASTLVLCAALTVLAKLTLYTCGNGFADLRSPSGHTSISVTFYGCCGLMVSAEKERWARIVLMLGSAAIAVAIAISRVAIEAHTIADVVAGFIIGAFCVAWFSARYYAATPAPLRWEPVVALVLVALAMHGRHWSLEGVISHIARLIQVKASFCV